MHTGTHQTSYIRSVRARGSGRGGEVDGEADNVRHKPFILMSRDFYRVMHLTLIDIKSIYVSNINISMESRSSRFTLTDRHERVGARWILNVDLS